MYEWEVKERKESWLDLEKRQEDDKHVWGDAGVKWDGCVHYRRHYNVPLDLREKDDGENTDYVHICSTAEVIEDMLAITAAGREAFGDEWIDEAQRVEKVLAKFGYLKVSP
jgi:hypothetical protein